MRQVEIPLTFDAEFFDILQGDVENLDKLQEEQHQTMIEEIGALSTELTTLVKYYNLSYFLNTHCKNFLIYR